MYSADQAAFQVQLIAAKSKNISGLKPAENVTDVIQSVLPIIRNPAKINYFKNWVSNETCTFYKRKIKKNCKWNVDMLEPCRPSQERLKSLHHRVFEIEEERNRSDHTLNNITKTHDKITLEGKLTPYYQNKLKGLYTTAVSDAEQEESLIRQALTYINEIRSICNDQRIQARSAGNKETFGRGDMMNMLITSALTLPLWVGQLGQEAPPLCGAVPADSSYVAKTGDMVAALVKSEEENWILAEVVQFNANTNRYEVDDIDEEQKDRHTLPRRCVVPLPLMRANPETDPDALFPKGSVVMALYPQTTCFYKAVVNQLPQTFTDDYELLFEDPTYADGYAPPLNVPQRYVIDIRDKKEKAQAP